MKHLQYHDVPISVSDLEIGMNIVSLDRPWAETNFLLQGFIIKSQDDIYQAQSQCEQVFVQIKMEEVEAFKLKLANKPKQPNGSTRRPGVDGPVTNIPVAYQDKEPFEKAVESARVTFDSARSMANTVMDGLRFSRNILMSMGSSHRHAVEVAHLHHKRIDGKGYPRGLNGDSIPYYSKLVSIVDAYDAMTSDRVYGAPKSSEFALDILLKNMGTQFDEALTKVFIKCIGVYPVGCLVELKSGEIAVVIGSNELEPASSKILIVSDEKKQPTPF